ncbi:MAG: Endonuclease III [Candidatus Argoarchaeum ethanivorans]|uniref:Endonuclease III n=1 Tax=Candidatus Argoarchaeum ethanivorans TaxID=2608793 RepID=A0A811THS8_9EURY|nr:MAG: Endonuclease III [Candidatus Argoarchaeum ethanivorans]
MPVSTAKTETIDKRFKGIMEPKKERVLEILRLLKKEYPTVCRSLDCSSPFKLLISTILSAQSTDATINKLTSKLFKKYNSFADFANAPLEELQQDIKSSGFYRNKAKNIKRTSRIIIEQFGGELPQKMEELLQLPGVGRKTANIVLSTAYGIVEGIAVDTHVKLVSNRLGLTNSSNQNKIEYDLMMLFSQKEWDNISLLLVRHGKTVCAARNHRCSTCVINHLCPLFFSSVR